MKKPPTTVLAQFYGSVNQAVNSAVISLHIRHTHHRRIIRAR